MPNYESINGNDIFLEKLDSIVADKKLLKDFNHITYLKLEIPVYLNLSRALIKNGFVDTIEQATISALIKLIRSHLVNPTNYPIRGLGSGKLRDLLLKLDQYNYIEPTPKDIILLKKEVVNVSVFESKSIADLKNLIESSYLEFSEDFTEIDNLSLDEQTYGFLLTKGINTVADLTNAIIFNYLDELEQEAVNSLIVKLESIRKIEA